MSRVHGPRDARAHGQHTQPDGHQRGRRGRRARPLAIASVLACTALALPDLAAQDFRLALPTGAQRGTEATVTCYGRGLSDTIDVVWLQSGIELVELKAERDDRITLKLKIPADCAPGIYPFALHTRRGLSRFKEFRVGTLPSVAEAANHGSRETAQPIPLEHTVDGRILPEEVDWYALDLAAGQTVHVEVEAVRLGYYDFDLQLEAFDPDGGLLQRSDDTPLGKGDPIVRVTATTAGTYHLALRETSWRGSSAGAYRMHVGTFPRPTGLMPIGGRPGEQLTMRTIGDAHDGEVTMQLPEEAGLYEFVPVINGSFAPSAVKVMVSERPHAIESKLPPEPPTAPFAFHGTIGAADERDSYEFRARKGERITLRVLAKALGSRLDPVLAVVDANGKTLVSNDDSIGLDGAARFSSPADGIYRAVVRDHLRRGGEEFFYYLELGATAGPATCRETVSGRRAEDFGVAVPRGQRNATVMQLSGIDLKHGIDLGFDELPAGVHAAPARLDPAQPLIPIVFESDADAEPRHSLATASARAEQEPHEREMRYAHRYPTLRVRNNIVYQSRLASALPVVVTDPLPFDLELEAPKTPILQSGALDLPISIRRDEGFEGTVTVQALWLPPGLSAATVRLTGKNTTGTMRLQTNSRASIGTWPLVLIASTSINGVNRTLSSAAQKLTIEAPWVTATLPRAQIEQGGKATFEIALQHNKKVEGAITVELMRLPTGIETTFPEITAETVKLPVALTAAADTRPGRHRSLYVRITVATPDGPVVHSVGSGELRVDRPLPPPPDQNPGSNR